MTTLDPELAKDLAAEMKALEPELARLVAELKANNDQPGHFERFGQIVDRVYGTAATFGMKELASYCGTLKKTCYECAKAANARASSRVVRLLETYVENLSSLIRGVTDPEAAKRMNFTLHVEEQKALKIHEEIFKFIKK